MRPCTAITIGHTAASSVQIGRSVVTSASGTAQSSAPATVAITKMTKSWTNRSRRLQRPRSVDSCADDSMCTDFASQSSSAERKELRLGTWPWRGPCHVSARAATMTTLHSRVPFMPVLADATREGRIRSWCTRMRISSLARRTRPASIEGNQCPSVRGRFCQIQCVRSNRVPSAERQCGPRGVPMRATWLHPPVL